MLRLESRNLWRQKHPTPSNGSWEFHWHPSNASPTAVSAVSSLSPSLQGRGPLSAWTIDHDSLLWIRTFQAHSPSEQRNYTGTVATLVVAGADLSPARWAAILPRVLIALQLPPASPFSNAETSNSIEVDPDDPLVSGERWQDCWNRFAGDYAATVLLASAACNGGDVTVAEATDPRLPVLLGMLLPWLPMLDRIRQRSGCFYEESFRPAGSGAAAEASETIAHYLARSWLLSGPTCVSQVWQMVGEFAGYCGKRLDTIYGELLELSHAWETAEGLQRYLTERVISEREVAECDTNAPSPLYSDPRDAGLLLNRVTNYWGRGYFGSSGDEMATRLAAVLATRILLDCLVSVDKKRPELALRYLRRLRLEALLTGPTKQRLLSKLEERMPTISTS